MKRLLAAGLAVSLLAAVGCSNKPSAVYDRKGDSYKPGPSAATAPAAPKTDAPAPGPKGDSVNISAADFVEKFRTGEKMLVIDVRTEQEYAMGHVPGAKLMPLQTLDQTITKYPKDQELYLICQTGNRSAQAYTLLKNMGYTKLHNVVGGTEGWKKLGGILEN